MKMKSSHACPCCRSALLRHIRRGGTYWFCSTCWQEIPDEWAGASLLGRLGASRPSAPEAARLPRRSAATDPSAEPA